ncbi:hypothetical protein [Desulfovibrio ferrophilus]|uniref:Uncharacterized protein n=1 Tax=Desulfovibrio ferrophilus TaxID=241368 RepID=A0A2Z6B0K6_9BACT|nr:hypothetical protein [Desulfovibrio ferrophilus]BBD08970.1 uncharacterized protein DFE_2244 [Desulfovibrio ferrophilus]
MSIHGIGYDTASDKMILQARETTEEDVKAAKQRTEDILNGDELLDKLTLSSLADKLSRMVQANPMANVANSMAEDLKVLQQEFVGVLTDTLQAGGVSVTRDFILQRDDSGKIAVSGDHPDKEAIEAALEDPKLQQAFARIEEQSETLSKLANNSTFKNVSSGLAAYMSQVEEDENDPFLIRYQQGTMNSLARKSLADYL